MNENIVLLGMSNYVRPDIVEVKSKDWVLNGKNNSFYQYTIDRFNGSPTNAAIINSYIDLIYGKGLRAKNANTNLKDWTKLKQILNPQDVRRIVSDFELFGQGSMQVIQTKGKDLSSIQHIAQNFIAPSLENEDMEIENYWVSKNWSKLYQNPPQDYPAFSGKHKHEIYSLQPYKAGKVYFSDPDYLAGMPYAEMEEEIANLNISSIKNGLSVGYIINVPDGKSLTPEEKDDFKKEINRKLVGSPNASGFVISFNGRDVEITITPFPVNDNIHKQWHFLTSESRQQLLTAHRVTSPMLFGIKDNTGLGNNADELDTAEAQLMKRVIAPKQKFITDAIETVLNQYGIFLDLEFVPLTVSESNKQIRTPIGAELPSSPVDDDTAKAQAALRGSVGGVQGVLGIQQSVSEKKTSFESAITILMEIYGFDREVAAALLGAPKTELSVQCSHEKKKDDLDILLEMYALDPPEGYALTDGAEYELQLASTANSKQDTKLWKVRYQYAKGTSKSAKGSSRQFCNKMMSLAGSGKVFREEDIAKMSKDGVNGKFAHSGGKYNIFLYGGGVNCFHRWERRIFKKQTQENGELYGGNATQNTKPVNVSEAKRQGWKHKGTPNSKDVAIAEIDKPNKGSLK